MAVANFWRLTWRRNSGRWVGRSNLLYDSKFRWPRGGRGAKKKSGKKRVFFEKNFNSQKPGLGSKFYYKNYLKKSCFVNSSCLHLEILGGKRGSAKISFLQFFWLCAPLDTPWQGQMPKEGCHTYFFGQNYTMRPFNTFAVIWFAQSRCFSQQNSLKARWTSK